MKKLLIKLRIAIVIIMMCILLLCLVDLTMITDVKDNKSEIESIKLRLNDMQLRVDRVSFKLEKLEG